jgi:ATP-binding cassette, subfamily C (CFTR/MRP), member 1
MCSNIVPADRLRTILSYDRIIVVDAGEIAVCFILCLIAFSGPHIPNQEFDTPLNLYDQGGIFHSLCKKSTLSRKDIEFEQQLHKVTS